MPERKRRKKQDDNERTNLPLSFFACPNSDYADFNHFDADNLPIAEWMGKDKAIRRPYCKTCGARFSERQGSLMQYTKLPQADVVRIVKCLGNGCSVEATADICEFEIHTVQRFLEKRVNMLLISITCNLKISRSPLKNRFPRGHNDESSNYN